MREDTGVGWKLMSSAGSYEVIVAGFPCDRLDNRRYIAFLYRGFITVTLLPKNENLAVETLCRRFASCIAFCCQQSKNRRFPHV
jgi:hypothetical protein